MSWRRAINGSFWPGVLGLALLIVFGVWTWVANRTAVSFGSPPQGELVQKIVHRGDRVDVSYDSIVWYRVAPSIITQYYECMVKDTTGKLYRVRFDLQSRVVPVPARPGPLPPKQRPVANQQDVPYPVPHACEPGLLHYGGFITVNTRVGLGPLSFEYPLIYDLPPKMDAEIQP